MRWLNAVAAFLVIVSGCVRSAPAQATIDSLSLVADSRYTWRNYDRGGMDVRASVGLGLAGFSRVPSSTQRSDLRLELASWNALTDRDDRDVFDQYAASLRYGLCLAACENMEWIKRWSLSLAASEYALPNASGKTNTAEIELGTRGYWDLDRIGRVQLGANLRPYLTIVRDLRRYDRTYSAAGVSTFLDAIGPFSVELSGAVAASDWPGKDGDRRAFGYHGGVLQLAIMRDLPFDNGHRHAEIMVGPSLNAPATKIGPMTGGGSVRLKLLGPLFR